MGFNILICDDSALARKMARSNLPTGFAETIYEVSNGMDALEVLAHHTIDLVLLDLTMPILGGISVLSEIKHRQLETFVIVVSGDIQPMMQEKVMSLGALGFIEKPIKQDELKALLHRFGFILPDTYQTPIAV
ncbi:response regulator [Alteromonas mediterranea]|uniref:response regulator n=1 Tax=Alteromonas mediterranea TaxID=314275 RepID=UPI000903301D|nr:response regulator [Alteromonas mediterranea]APD95021.1 response regulator [Alteromonas mediterranea]APD98656.1 response regulator [Alteromonas mediterranea]QDG39439.1 response regulator [Alteromonas mediterranea]